MKGISLSNRLTFLNLILFFIVYQPHTTFCIQDEILKSSEDIDISNNNSNSTNCPCISKDACPRLYGKSAADIQEFGFVKPCLEYGHVRCCGVSITITKSVQEIILKEPNDSETHEIIHDESRTIPLRESMPTIQNQPKTPPLPVISGLVQNKTKKFQLRIPEKISKVQKIQNSDSLSAVKNGTQQPDSLSSIIPHMNQSQEGVFLASNSTHQKGRILSEPNNVSQYAIKRPSITLKKALTTTNPIPKSKLIPTSTPTPKPKAPGSPLNVSTSKRLRTNKEISPVKAASKLPHTRLQTFNRYSKKQNQSQTQDEEISIQLTTTASPLRAQPIRNDGFLTQIRKFPLLQNRRLQNTTTEATDSILTSTETPHESSTDQVMQKNTVFTSTEASSFLTNLPRFDDNRRSQIKRRRTTTTTTTEPSSFIGFQSVNLNANNNYYSNNSNNIPSNYSINISSNNSNNVPSNYFNNNSKSNSSNYSSNNNIKWPESDETDNNTLVSPNSQINSIDFAASINATNDSIVFEDISRIPSTTEDTVISNEPTIIVTSVPIGMTTPYPRMRVRTTTEKIFIVNSHQEEPSSSISNVENTDLETNSESVVYSNETTAIVKQEQEMKLIASTNDNLKESNVTITNTFESVSVAPVILPLPTNENDPAPESVTTKHPYRKRVKVVKVRIPRPTTTTPSTTTTEYETTSTSAEKSNPLMQGSNSQDDIESKPEPEPEEGQIEEIDPKSNIYNTESTTVATEQQEIKLIALSKVENVTIMNAANFESSMSSTTVIPHLAENESAEEIMTTRHPYRKRIRVKIPRSTTPTTTTTTTITTAAEYVTLSTSTSKPNFKFPIQENNAQENSQFNPDPENRHIFSRIHFKEPQPSTRIRSRPPSSSSITMKPEQVINSNSNKFLPTTTPTSIDEPLKKPNPIIQSNSHPQLESKSPLLESTNEKLSTRFSSRPTFTTTTTQKSSFVFPSFNAIKNKLREGPSQNDNKNKENQDTKSNLNTKVANENVGNSNQKQNLQQAEFQTSKNVLETKPQTNGWTAMGTKTSEQENSESPGEIDNAEAIHVEEESNEIQSILDSNSHKSISSNLPPDNSNSFGNGAAKSSPQFSVPAYGTRNNGKNRAPSILNPVPATNPPVNIYSNQVKTTETPVRVNIARKPSGTPAMTNIIRLIQTSTPTPMPSLKPLLLKQSVNKEQQIIPQQQNQQQQTVPQQQNQQQQTVPQQQNQQQQTVPQQQTAPQQQNQQQQTVPQQQTAPQQQNQQQQTVPQQRNQQQLIIPQQRNQVQHTIPQQQNQDQNNIPQQQHQEKHIPPPVVSIPHTHYHYQYQSSLPSQPPTYGFGFGTGSGPRNPPTSLKDLAPYKPIEKPSQILNSQQDSQQKTKPIGSIAQITPQVPLPLSSPFPSVKIEQKPVLQREQQQQRPPTVEYSTSPPLLPALGQHLISKPAFTAINNPITLPKQAPSTPVPAVHRFNPFPLSNIQTQQNLYSNNNNPILKSKTVRKEILAEQTVFPHAQQQPNLYHSQPQQQQQQQQQHWQQVEYSNRNRGNVGTYNSWLQSPQNMEFGHSNSVQQQHQQQRQQPQQQQQQHVQQQKQQQQYQQQLQQQLTPNPQTYFPRFRQSMRTARATNFTDLSSLETTPVENNDGIKPQVSEEIPKEGSEKDGESAKMVIPLKGGELIVEAFIDDSRKKTMIPVEYLAASESRAVTKVELVKDFKEPEFTQRGFIPVVPYSEEDPGLVRVKVAKEPAAKSIESVKIMLKINGADVK